MSHQSGLKVPQVDRYEVKVQPGPLGFHAFLFAHVNGRMLDLLPIEEVPPMKTERDAEELALVVLWQQLQGCTDLKGEPLSVLI